MAKLVVRNIKETLLYLDNPEGSLFSNNHIYEPDFHQEEYVCVCEKLAAQKKSYQLGKCTHLAAEIHRGIQPKYADDDTDPDSLYWLGMMSSDGKTVKSKNANICALKSICIRSGYIDLETARSVSREFYAENKSRAGVQKNDVLINSTGDGTIGRVAVYNYDFPAVVDGHITILRFLDAELAWYAGAFLMSDMGQKQITRYINGSSGQVEIYPQDIARIWINSPPKERMSMVSGALKAACEKYEEFRRDIKVALNGVGTI
jgi:hypothetical protein